MRDRAISLEFFTHRVSRQSTLCNFPNIFLPLKITVILNFRIFANNAKTQICFYLFNLKMTAILNFQIFAENGKTQIGFYLLNRVK